ncbi:MAG: YihY/virulence factor BrkB family protein [Salibacteraceae bacterium]
MNFILLMAMKIKGGLANFINERVWKVRLEDLNPWTAFFIKQLRIVLIVLKNYSKDNLQLQSAGLTFYTILSVVPLVALVFAVAKGFGFQENLEKQLHSALKGHEEVVNQIMEFAVRMLESTKGGLLAGVGVVVLLWTVLRLLSNIEVSFNEIWQVNKGRTWVRKFTEYFSIMLLAPIIIIIAGSITVVISGELENLVAGYDFLQTIGPAIHFLIKIIPYSLIWLVFTFVYMVIPNTKVNFKSALVAGIIAGTAFQIVEWGYINFQVGVSRYNTIYGSFAALPLFMIWVNTSWLITLIGAEIAYANQYVSEIENEIDADKLSNSQTHVLAILMMQQISKTFELGGAPLSAKDISSNLNLPYGVTAKVLEHMCEAHLISEIDSDQDKVAAYLPSKSIENQKVSDVIDALDETRYTEIHILDSAVFKRYFDIYKQIKKAAGNADKNVLIRNLPSINLNEDLNSGKNTSV